MITPYFTIQFIVWLCMLFTKDVNINVRHIVSCNINQKRILASLKVKQTQTTGLFDLPVSLPLDA